MFGRFIVQYVENVSIVEKHVGRSSVEGENALLTLFFLNLRWKLNRFTEQTKNILVYRNEAAAAWFCSRHVWFIWLIVAQQRREDVTGSFEKQTASQIISSTGKASWEMSLSTPTVSIWTHSGLNFKGKGKWIQFKSHLHWEETFWVQHHIFSIRKQLLIDSWQTASLCFPSVSWQSVCSLGSPALGASEN